MSKEALGEFEHQVLLTMLRLGGEVFTAAIVVELERVSQRSVAPAAVYIALRRLEKRGLVSSNKEEAAPGEGGRGRRFFRISDAAVERLRTSREIMERLWEGLDPTFDRA